MTKQVKYRHTRLCQSRLQQIHGYTRQNQLLGLVQHVLTRESNGYSKELYYISQLYQTIFDKITTKLIKIRHILVNFKL
jgi:hypothetical protein